MSYAGFDRDDLPTSQIMNWLRANTNLQICSFYLPSPSNAGVTYIGKRDQLIKAGWGLAPIYVGQQITGPGSHTVTAYQGKLDGVDAAKQMNVAGFPKSACVYLDLENGPPMPTLQAQYVSAWCGEVAAAGYVPGIYVSYLMADSAKQAYADARLWVFHVKTVKEHKVAGDLFATVEPGRSGYAAANGWQYDDAALISVNGEELLVDLDVWDVADPSLSVDLVADKSTTIYAAKAPQTVAKETVKMPNTSSANTQGTSAMAPAATTAKTAAPAPAAAAPVSTPAVPSVSSPVTVDWGDALAQFIKNETAIVESVAQTGLNAALAEIPFGNIISSFIGPTVINQYIQQGLTALEGVLSGQTISASNAIETYVFNAINSFEPELASILGTQLPTLIQEALSKLGIKNNS